MGKRAVIGFYFFLVFQFINSPALSQDKPGYTTVRSLGGFDKNNPRVTWWHGGYISFNSFFATNFDRGDFTDYHQILDWLRQHAE